MQKTQVQIILLECVGAWLKAKERDDQLIARFYAALIDQLNLILDTLESVDHGPDIHTAPPTASHH